MSKSKTTLRILPQLKTSNTRGFLPLFTPPVNSRPNHPSLFFQPPKRFYSTKPEDQETKLPQTESKKEIEIPDNLEVDEDFIAAISKTTAIFVAGAGYSALYQPAISLAYEMTLKKMRYGQDYQATAKKISETTLKDLFDSSLSVLEKVKGAALELQKVGKPVWKRRVKSSVLAAAAVAGFGGNLHPATASFISALFESWYSGIKEPKERFKIITKEQFPHLKDYEDLSDPSITEEKFNELLEKFDGDKTKVGSYEDLQNGLKNLRENIYTQFAAIFSRNYIFALAIFLAAPLVAKFVEENGDEIYQKTGIKKELQTKVLTNLLRGSFAFLTTPLDNVLTLSSSGNFKLEELKSKSAASYFTGGAFRTIFSLITSHTIKRGIEVGQSSAKSVEQTLRPILETGIKTGQTLKEFINQTLQISVDNFKNLEAEYIKTTKKEDKTPSIEDSTLAGILVDDNEFFKAMTKEFGNNMGDFLEGISHKILQITTLMAHPKFIEQVLFDSLDRKELSKSYSPVTSEGAIIPKTSPKPHGTKSEAMVNESEGRDV